MASNFEFFPTHSDWILDATLEIEGEALRNHLQDTSIHEIHTILTHIECTIHILFTHLESCYSNDS